MGLRPGWFTGEDGPAGFREKAFGGMAIGGVKDWAEPSGSEIQLPDIV